MSTHKDRVTTWSLYKDTRIMWLHDLVSLYKNFILKLKSLFSLNEIHSIYNIKQDLTNNHCEKCLHIVILESCSIMSGILPQITVARATKYPCLLSSIILLFSLYNILDSLPDKPWASRHQNNFLLTTHYKLTETLKHNILSLKDLHLKKLVQNQTNYQSYSYNVCLTISLTEKLCLHYSSTA